MGGLWLAGWLVGCVGLGLVWFGCLVGRLMLVFVMVDYLAFFVVHVF